MEKGEIVIYQPDNSIRLDVRIDQETVWLNQSQIGILFGVDRTVVVRHIGNIYKAEELEEYATCVKIAQVQIEGKRKVERMLNYYNLDMILSVGYRVNSKNATVFRRWATRTLKDYLLRGYAINPRLEQLEQRVQRTEEKIDFFVRTSLPPVEGIFYDGQIFDAYTFAADLIRKASRSIILIDNYIDETVLTLLDKRLPDVEASIYTRAITDKLHLDLERHNAQYPAIQIFPFSRSHDRFLIIDDDVYHIGASLKDLGKKWFAFSKMNDLSRTDLLGKVCP